MPRHRTHEPAHKLTDPDAEASPGMTATRRQVIVGAAAASVTVAAVGAGVAGTTLAGTALAAESSRSSSKEPVVAHVRDVASGQIDVFVGDRQVTIRDRAVAARLANVAR
jgi:hypothetical protein